MYLIVTGNFSHTPELTLEQQLALAEKNAQKEMVISFPLTQAKAAAARNSNLSAASSISSTSSTGRREAIIHSPKAGAMLPHMHAELKRVQKQIKYKIAIPPQAADSNCQTLDFVSNLLQELYKKEDLHANLSVATMDNDRICYERVFIVEADNENAAEDLDVIVKYLTEKYHSLSTGQEIKELPGVTLKPT